MDDVDYCEDHDWEEDSRKKEGKVDVVIYKCALCGIFMMESEKRK